MVPRVTETERLPIGRPWITLANRCCTRVVHGSIGVSDAIGLLMLGVSPRNALTPTDPVLRPGRTALRLTDHLKGALHAKAVRARC
jgi:hypothetical protein